MLVVGLGGESSSEPLLAMDSVHRRVAGLRNILQGIRGSSEQRLRESSFRHPRAPGGLAQRNLKSGQERWSARFELTSLCVSAGRCWRRV
jgi:hypothetical protein